jgi:hypothetical protein
MIVKLITFDNSLIVSNSSQFKIEATFFIELTNLNNESNSTMMLIT